jgi:hypothetical protein
LAEEIRKRKIPCTVSNGSFTVWFNDDKEAEANFRIVQDAEVPLVYINGMAKGNPRVDEVVTQYQSMLGRAAPHP